MILGYLVWKFETRVDPQGSTIQTSQIKAFRVSHLFINILLSSGENKKKKWREKWRKSRNDPLNCYNILYPGANMQQCCDTAIQV